MSMPIHGWQVLLRKAKAALGRDEQLRGMRFKLVPTRVSEKLFWRHFMLRVLRERRLFGLPDLRDCLTSPEAEAEAEAEAVTVAGAAVAAPGRAEVADDQFHSVDLQQAEAEADALLLAAKMPTSARRAPPAPPPAAAPAAAAVAAPSPAAASSPAAAPASLDETFDSAAAARGSSPAASTPANSHPGSGSGFSFTPATVAVGGAAPHTATVAPPPDSFMAPVTPASSAFSATPATAAPSYAAATPTAAAAAATVVAAANAATTAANAAANATHAADAAADASDASPATPPPPAPPPVVGLSPAPETISPAPPQTGEAATADELEARIARELELGDGSEDDGSGEDVGADEDFDVLLGDD